MAKVILSLENRFLGEYQLDKERIAIGRRPINDILIDNLAVSGEHAAILRIGNDYYVEDLGSTNGTSVNSKEIKKQLLQHADIIEFGKYQLKYINESVLSNLGMVGTGTDFEKTMMIRPSEVNTTEQKSLSGSTAIPNSSMHTVVGTSTVKNAPEVIKVLETGKIQVLNGSSAGRELVLNKALTTLGKPGIQVAVITKRPNGYFVTHVEGNVFPIVNGATIGAQAFALNNHDVIELSGVKMEFYLDKI